MRNQRVKIIIMTQKNCVAICNVLVHAGYAVSPCHDFKKIHTQIKRFQADLILISDDMKFKPMIKQLSHYPIVVLDDQNQLSQYTQLKKAINFDTDFLRNIEEIVRSINRLKQREQLASGYRSKVFLAKKLLMKKYHISEAVAYNYLRKESMNKCLAIEALSEKVIRQLKS